MGKFLGDCFYENRLLYLVSSVKVFFKSFWFWFEGLSWNCILVIWYWVLIWVCVIWCFFFLVFWDLFVFFWVILCCFFLIFCCVFWVKWFVFWFWWFYLMLKLVNVVRRVVIVNLLFYCWGLVMSLRNLKLVWL